MRSVPTNHEEHTAEIIELLPKLVLRLQGCLVLFASAGRWKSQQGDASTHFTASADTGALPKREILLRHKLRIDRGEPSIIFGMASFSEGVDLPGVYCNNVIIAKLPFSVPTDPVGQTLTEWLEKNGRDAFREISIPEACLKLTQSVGRLIRTESDTGAVTIWIKRLKTKPTGKTSSHPCPFQARNSLINSREVAMHKIECPRCLGGRVRSERSGTFKAVCVFAARAGVCRGENHPEAFYPVCCYAEMGKSEDVNYNNGDFIRTFYFKARSQAEATKKLQKNSARQVVSFMPLLRMMSSNKWGRFVVVYSL